MQRLQGSVGRGRVSGFAGVAVCALAAASMAYGEDPPQSVRALDGPYLLYVDDDALPGGDGASWTTAFRFLQTALTEAVPFTEIRVAQGTYLPDRDELAPGGSGIRPATFLLRDHVTLRGGYAGIGTVDPNENDTILYPSILSGDLAGDDGPDFLNNGENSFHVVTGSGAGSSAVVDGFTITAGNAEFRNGGAILVEAGGPTLRNTTIRDNIATGGAVASSGRGAGLYAAAGSSVRVERSSFDGNVVVGGLVSYSGFGSAVACDSASHVTLEICTFTGNTAVGTVSATGWGGALSCSDGSSVLLSDCEVSLNAATGSERSTGLGGAMVVTLDSSAIVTGSSFVENSANATGAVHVVQRSSAIVTDSLFNKNSATAGAVFIRPGAGAIRAEDDSSLEIRGSSFINNRATAGSALRAGALYVYDSSVVIEGSAFHQNEAGYGGAVYLVRSPSTVADTTFVGNAAIEDGGAVFNVDSPLTMAAATFTGNSAVDGGAVFNDWADSSVIMCSMFRENRAAGSGGALYNRNSAPELCDTQFSRNTAMVRGGAVYNLASETTIVNSTLMLNEAALAGGGSYNADGSVAVLTSVIFWDNTNGEIVNDASTAVVSYSDVQGGHPGRANIDANPMCVDPANGDFRLLPGSPCIDSGVNNAVPPDTLDLDHDGKTNERVPVDVLGNPRFSDDPGVDRGCGVPFVVDMGVCESIGVPVHPVLVGDVDGDGAVGFIDMMAVLSTWGACPGDCCLADVDYSWKVDLEDLMIVLANWS